MRGCTTPCGPSAVAIGILDGVHIGHRSLVRKALTLAGEHGLQSVVHSFLPHPAKVLAPAHAPSLIEPVELRAERLAHAGVDALILQPFDLEFSRMRAQAFIEDILVGCLRAQHVVVGYNFHFGHGQEGNGALLAEEGRRHGFDVHIMPAVSLGEERISSSRIREEIRRGNVKLAADLMGHSYVLRGQVVPGEGRGSKIGFATANIDPLNELLPGVGVYVAWARVNGETRRAVVNVGHAPTFGDVELRVEAHLLDYGGGELYGAPMDLAFIEKVRDERAFDSIDALKAQIRLDAQRSKEVLAPLPLPGYEEFLGLFSQHD